MMGIYVYLLLMGNSFDDILDFMTDPAVTLVKQYTQSSIINNRPFVDVHRATGDLIDGYLLKDMEIFGYDDVFIKATAHLTEEVKEYKDSFGKDQTAIGIEKFYRLMSFNSSMDPNNRIKFGNYQKTFNFDKNSLER